MAKTNKTDAASASEAAIKREPLVPEAAINGEPLVPEAAINGEPLGTINEVVDDVPKVLPKEIIRVRAVIRPMYAPFNGIMIPDEGPGVLIESGSWTDVQLERGLIQKC